MPEDNQHFLPKEPLDLPKPHETLPPHVREAERKEEAPQEYNPHDVRTLLSWHAPGRPFRKRTKAYFINVILIALAVEVILFIFGQYMLMAVVAALVFLVYALNTVPPTDFRYQISTEGIMIEDRFFLWQELYDFYFKNSDGEDLLVVRMRAYVPGELFITLGDIHKEHVKSVLIPYLPYREFVTPTFMEKAGDWLKKTFPLDHSPHAS